jgi:serine/threonine protein kinase
MPEYFLDVISGPDAGRSLQVPDGKAVVLGRGQACELKINDPRMSRSHCTLQVDGGKLTLHDNQSTSGVFLGAQRISEHVWLPGQVVKLGDTEISCRLGSQTDEQTMGARPPAAAALAPKIPPLQSLVGKTLGPYRLDKIISSGNTGMVFLATDTETDQRVALKALTPDLAHSDEQKERFVRAMKTMLPIKHPNIIRLIQAGKNGPFCWAAMEFIDGENLAQVIDRIGVEGMLDWRDVWRVAMHIGRALQAAQESKIIHRNVTPTNILRRKSDKVSLLGDLMLAKAIEGNLAAQVTRPGQLIGDLPYMSPERTREGAVVDGRSDLYGLGATLYALLTGRPPYESNSLPELVKQIRADTPPPPPKQFQLSIVDKFQDVVMQLLAKRPEDRYDSPGTMIKELMWVGKLNNLNVD